MKLSEVFKVAKQYLNTPGGREDTTYICIAILLAEQRTNGITPANYRDARGIVMSRLGQAGDCVSYTAECWLRERHNGLKLSAANMQTWRHMWLDQLIAEFQAKGE